MRDSSEPLQPFNDRESGLRQPVVYQKIARQDCTKRPICAEG